MRLLLVGVEEGLAAFCPHDISIVMPDTSAPAKRTVIYSGTMPQGVSVTGDSETVIGLWMAALEQIDFDDEDDEEDEGEEE